MKYRILKNTNRESYLVQRKGTFGWRLCATETGGWAVFNTYRQAVNWILTQVLEFA